MSRWLVIRPRLLPISFRLDARVPLVLLMLGLAAFAAIVVSIGVGEYPIPPLEVLRALRGEGSRQTAFVVNSLRLPRALVAFSVGTALAVSGAILQGLTRNPLASPDVVGVSSGAGLGAAAVIVLFPAAPWSALPPAAFAGAVAAAGLTYLLGWKRGSHPTRLLLVGIGIAAVAHALINVIISGSKVNRIGEAMVWLAGSAYGRGWEHLRPLLPWLAVFLPLAFAMARHLNALGFGDDVARALGSQVEWQRSALLLASVALAGASVATAGTVGFVGLMAPHMARRLVGPLHGGLLPTAGMVGGLVVVLADLLGRTLFAPVEIPCGVITAAVGAPYFLYLLYRQRNA